MERLLPECRPMVIALRVIVVLGFAGCSNQQMSASNPFMSPDRVPPPSTRTIAPGTAAPYYPGDPVPAAQNAAPGQPALAQTAPLQPPGTPVVPPPTTPAQVAAAPVAQAAPTSTTPQPLAFTNERNVSIPTDSQDLRFAVPPPPEVPATQAVASSTQQLQVAQQSAVIPAAYNQGVATQPMPAASPIPSPTTDSNSDGPWRSPQIRGSNSPVTQAQYVQPHAMPQSAVAAQASPFAVAPAAPQMPVELRAVPSPTNGPTMVPTQNLAPMQTMAPAQQTQMAPLATSPPPRMRFPSWTEPSTWFTSQPEPTANQQLVGYMVPGPNGAQQMVSVEQYQAMMSGTVQPAAVANSDGFRARGTSTK